MSRLKKIKQKLGIREAEFSDYTTSEQVILLISLFAYPIFLYFTTDFDSTETTGQLLLWFSLTLQFAWLHIKLRKYREYYWESNQSLTQEEK